MDVHTYINTHIYIYMPPRVFSSLETVTMSYKHCDNFITERFKKNSYVIFFPCII